MDLVLILYVSRGDVNDVDVGGEKDGQKCIFLGFVGDTNKGKCVCWCPTVHHQLPLYSKIKPSPPSGMQHFPLNLYS